jgi:hypothetical protein
MESSDDEEVNNVISSNSNFPKKSIFIPSTRNIIIILIVVILIIYISEKIFINLIYLIIPSYIALIIIWIIVHLILLRWLIMVGIFPGKNPLIQFYLRNVQARIRAKFHKYELNVLKKRIEKLIKKNDLDKSQMNSKSENKDKIIDIDIIENPRTKFSFNQVEIYNMIKGKYNNLSETSKKFLDLLTELKNNINKSEYNNHYNLLKSQKENEIQLTNNDINLYNEIIKNIDNILIIINEFLYEEKFRFLNIPKYIKTFFTNDIFRTKEYSRMHAIFKKSDSEQLTIESDGLKLDCLLIKCDNYLEENNKNNKNIVIVCGPNLTPFENLIRSWDIEQLYLLNNTDVLFWNYRGFGFSEGSSNLNNVLIDVENIYEYVVKLNVYKKIAVHGLSIGGTSACHLANKKKVDLLIADRTFGSVENIIDNLFLGKYIHYLAKILFFPYIDNSNNFIQTKCTKILMNDSEDLTIVDKISLKSQTSRKIIEKIFNEFNVESNVRNLKSVNILEYCFLNDEIDDFYDSFIYIINQLKSYKLNRNKMQLEKAHKHSDNKNLHENLNVKEFGEYLKTLEELFNNFVTCGDNLNSFQTFDSSKHHFNHFWNNFVIYGCDNKNFKEFSICTIQNNDEILNELINSLYEILENEDYSSLKIFHEIKKFTNDLNKFKTFLLGMHLKEMDDNNLLPLKGILIPLYCGHIAFYDDKELDTLKYIINECFVINNNFNPQSLIK